MSPRSRCPSPPSGPSGWSGHYERGAMTGSSRRRRRQGGGLRLQRAISRLPRGNACPTTEDRPQRLPDSRVSPQIVRRRSANGQQRPSPANGVFAAQRPASTFVDDHQSPQNCLRRNVRSRDPGGGNAVGVGVSSVGGQAPTKRVARHRGGRGARPAPSSTWAGAWRSRSAAARRTARR